MFEFSAQTDVQLVPTASASTLSSTVASYSRGLSMPPIPPPTEDSSSLALSLLSSATATAPARPLSKHTTKVLSGLFRNLQALEEATRTEMGSNTIANYLGEKILKDMEDFWDVEWSI